MKTSDGAKNEEVRVGVSWRWSRIKEKEEKRGILELIKGNGIRVGIY